MRSTIRANNGEAIGPLMAPYWPSNAVSGDTPPLCPLSMVVVGSFKKKICNKPTTPKVSLAQRGFFADRPLGGQ